MLRLTSKLKTYAAEATDGKIGAIRDFLFDDKTWKVKWLIVDTNSWLVGRKFLVHPSSISNIDDIERIFRISLTMAEIKDGPHILDNQPVSRQMENQLCGYYGWNSFWGGNFYNAGAMAAPFSSRPYFGGFGTGEINPLQPAPDDQDPHLRSFSEVSDYHIHANDGNIGHIEDLVIEDEGWGIRYLVVDTRNWWVGQHVLVSPYAVREISWGDRQIQLDISREQIRSSPPRQTFDAVDKDYEMRLHRHFGWPGYGW